ncbi:zinc-dependent metalloprotease [Uliginosibacterium sediminicola]|uniref:Zinc-dependent metalloprotease n=1 Tax=Uliginosibacterium sediminicola TaxID=2024550 RepID=A0ABU9YX39_9RHOO
MPNKPRTPHTLRWLKACCGVLIALCPLLSSAQSSNGSSSSASSTSGNGSSAVTSSAPQRPFMDVIKDYRRIPGFFTIWQKEDRFLIELRESDFNKPFYFVSHNAQSIGESPFVAGLLLDGTITQWRRTSVDRVQWVERNTRFFADGNKPLERAVGQAFPDSLIAAAPIVSQPHPQTKAVLVDLNILLLNDIPGAGPALEGSFRAPYAFDRGNSQILAMRSSSQELTFDLRYHFGLSRLPSSNSANGAPVRLPANVPDPRSVFLGFHFSFSPLPAETMRPRDADPRVGYFFTTRWDFHDDARPDPRVHYISRWRLEKKDEQAELSEPKQPITFWIDRNVPERYRQVVREGILLWNEAFERIGFKDAIVVKQQTDDADFDTLDRQHASVRWYIGTNANVAIGPSVTDPRSGEILDADVVIADVFTRGARRNIEHEFPSRARAAQQALQDALCDYPNAASVQFQEAYDLLLARGELKEGSPEAEAFIDDYMRLIVAHEVGHTLGLTHNFIASKAFTPAQLRDPAYIASHGTVASVMDYVPVNLSLAGEKPAPYFQKHLGAYDLWAIEYGYKPLPPENEKLLLDQLAARGRYEPTLAYANDIDALGNQGVDPDVNMFDLGNDIQTWFERRVQIARERIDWIARRPPGEHPYPLARESVMSSLSGLADSAQNLAKKVGGIRSVHEPSQRMPSFTPVPAAEQRRALDSLTRALFSSDSFRVPPALLQRLPMDHLNRFDDLIRGNVSSVDPQVPLVALVSRVQNAALERLVSDRTTLRLLDSELLRSTPEGALQLGDMLHQLNLAIWSELDKPGAEIDLIRRNLQRNWLGRLSGFVTHPSAGTPPDVRSLARLELQQLRGRLQRSLRSKHTPSTEAHLREALNIVDEALQARLLKLG